MNYCLVGVVQDLGKDCATMDKDISFTVIEAEDEMPPRLDALLAQYFGQYSRTLWKKHIENGGVLVNNRLVAAKTRLRGGENIDFSLPKEQSTRSFEPQQLPLDIVHEDEELVIINKTSGMVVHPAAGNPDGTLLNALLFHFPELTSLPRSGIVHRLDRGTSGLLVIAKTLPTYLHLVRNLQQRNITRRYIALVHGHVISGGTVDAPLGRCPRNWRKRAVIQLGKPSRTHYRVKTRYGTHTLLEVMLETGRTHQIRVHMSHIGFPIAGDTLYGGRRMASAPHHSRIDSQMELFPRPFLHAACLSFSHPKHQNICTWEACIPQDMRKTLTLFDTHKQM